MLYLLLAAAAIVIACFCLVFGLDKTRPFKMRRQLLIIALIFAIIVGILVTLIMQNPLR